MQEKDIIKISLFCSLLGIVLLYLTSSLLNLKYHDIGDITKENLNEVIRIKGEINSIRTIKTVTMAKVKDKTGSIDIVIFKNDKDLKKVKNVEIEGKVTEYGGKLELIANSITEK